MIVSWSFTGGGGCPQGVIIPYYVILYEPPAGGALTKEVPGDHVVRLDSVITIPKIQARGPVTLVAGEDPQVHLSL